MTLVTKYDEKQRKIPHQQVYDYNTRSNSKSNDSPRLIITMRSANISKQNQNKLGRVAV